MAKLAGEEEQAAEKKAQEEDEAKMAKREAEDKEFAESHVYFDGNEWTADMPEHLLKGTGAAALKHANLNQVRRLRI